MKMYENNRDTKPDTWVAEDRQGRKVSVNGNEMVGAPKDDKIVAIFYFLWLSGKKDYQPGPYDVSKILEEHPDALDDINSPPWGGHSGCTHHWGESLFGYYKTDDEYVLRKHAQMLGDAGVDVIIFDLSNFQPTNPPGAYYKENFLKLFEVFSQIRAEGKFAPYVAFLCPFWAEPFAVEQLYKDVYSKGLYKDIWFMWKNKPLILFDPKMVKDPEILNFFTFRRDQPSYFEGPTGPNEWSWLEMYPQHGFYNDENPDKVEQVSVGIGQNAVVNPEGGHRLGAMSERDENGTYIGCGRSFHNGKQPQPGDVDFNSEKGYNFMEQWERAFELDPEVVFVTGWNEWIMGRFQKFSHYSAPSIFVDQFNQEFSRDIEPMRGGHLDDYYYQLIDYVRKFKGARQIPFAEGAKTIDIDGDFKQWRGVEPEYLDDVLDCPERNYAGWGEAGPYLEPAGRNDFEAMKVSYDEKNVYFYVKTVANITKATSEHWMHLFIKTDENAPAWENFNYVVNRHISSPTSAWLEKSKGGWSWEKVCDITLKIAKNEMHFAIPREALGLKGKISFDFKWTDMMAPWEDILQLYTKGDTAPNGRFCYRYQVK